MFSPSYFPPKIQNREVPILLYADDLVLISQNQIGLRRMLTNFGQICKEDNLKINYSKTKIVSFGSKRAKHKWRIDGNNIEQVNTFKYLGIRFSNNLKWNQHVENISLSTSRSLGLLRRFFYARGGQLVTPMIKALEAKILPQMLYGVELWGEAAKGKLEVLQNTFIRQILGVPKGTPSVLIRTELGLPSLASRIDLAFLRFWKKLYLSDDTALARTCWEEQLTCGGWARQTLAKLNKYNLAHDKFLALSSKELREWCFNWDADQDKASLWESRFSVWYPFFYKHHVLAPYLEQLTSPQLRRAFMELRFQLMPSAYLDGRYKNIPPSERLCIYGCGQVEDILHYLLKCPLYSNPRARFLDPCTNSLCGYSPAQLVCYLLEDVQDKVTYAVAHFAIAAKKLRRCYVNKFTSRA